MAWVFRHLRNTCTCITLRCCTPSSLGRCVHPSTEKADFGYPDCDEISADDLDDFDASHNITACYHSDQYEGVVDLDHNEGFSVDKKTHQFEM